MEQVDYIFYGALELYMSFILGLLSGNWYGKGGEDCRSWDFAGGLGGVRGGEGFMGRGYRIFEGDGEGWFGGFGV